jgi:hypothetical protein
MACAGAARRNRRALVPLSGSAAVSAFLLAGFAGMTLVSLTYPPDSRLLPIVVGIPATLLCAGQLVADLRAQRGARPTNRRERIVLGWCLALLGAILLFGFELGAPPLVAAFLAVDQQVRLGRAALAGLTLFAVLHLTFARLLGLPLFDGLLLGRLALPI